MIKDQLIPQIRFKGFKDEWAQHELGKIGKTYSGLSGKNKNDFGHGQAKYVTYMNVFSNPVSRKEYVEPIEIDKSQSEVEYGDILFTTSSETPEEVGMSSVWLESEKNVYLNSFCFGYRSFLKTEPYYMAYMLRSDQVRKKIKFLAQGISRYNISKNKMMEINVSIPEYKEQKEIGLYFKNINKLISLEQERYNKLINVKKSLLGKMFPKENDKVPQIRFKEFSDDWKKSKLNEISEIIGGGTPSTSNPDYWDGDIDWYAPAEMEGKIYANGSVRKITKIGLKNSSAKILPAHRTVLFTSRAGIGKMAVLQREGSTNQGFQSIVLNIGHSPYFIYSMGDLIKRKVEVISSGSTFLEISGKMLGNLEIMVPKESEQNAIARYFEILDTLITLNGKKIKKLENVKKALLNKMFV